MRRLRQLKRFMIGGERELWGALLEIQLHIRDRHQREVLYDAAEALWLSGLEADAFRKTIRKMIARAEGEPS